MEQQTSTALTLSVSGMSCGGCAAGLERALTQTWGVRQARVNFDTGEATVEYDPERTDPEALSAVVVRAGFQAMPLP